LYHVDNIFINNKEDKVFGRKHDNVTEALSSFFFEKKVLSRTCHVCGCMIQKSMQCGVMRIEEQAGSCGCGSHFMGMVQVQGPDLLVPVIRITDAIIASVIR
jgi:hypothetical protein